jgi:hypothetical protein
MGVEVSIKALKSEGKIIESELITDDSLFSHQRPIYNCETMQFNKSTLMIAIAALYTSAVSADCASACQAVYEYILLTMTTNY